MVNGMIARMPPPPKHPSQRRRTNATLPMIKLPASGYDGAIPAFPLGQHTKREREVWADIWRTPAAAAWAKLDWTRDVAMYVRYSVLAESGDYRAASEARLASDRIGLNPLAMLKLRWEIAPDEDATVHELKATGTSGSTTSARDRAAALGVRPVADEDDE